MPYTYTLTSVIPATPQDIYDAWLDSIAHSEMTGGEAVMSDEVGADVSAWDGYITGRNLELVPGERIVQSWRTTRFGEEHGDSVVTLTLEGTDEGTLLTLVHSNVPDEQKNYEEGGWESNYFEPMRAYFAGLDEEAGEPPAQPAAPKPASKKPAKRAAKPAPKPAPKPAAKVRHAAGKKTKKARAKASPARKKKIKRAAPAKKKRKGVKAAAKKSVKRAAAKSKSRRKVRSHR